jgi:hypothetical protein
MLKAVVFGATLMLFLLCTTFVYAEVHVGVKTGDWVKCDSTGTPYEGLPRWVKIECLSVMRTTVTLRMISHMSYGKEEYVCIGVSVLSVIAIVASVLIYTKQGRNQ